MPKHTRIYTRTGDDGTTGLVGGPRVKKNSLRIEAYGTVDELSSAIGVARVALRPAETSLRASLLNGWLAWTQDALFNLGSQLATLPEHRWDTMPVVGEREISALERAIDEAEADLPALNTFILPGGSPAGAQLHVARTVCRRAERRLVELRDADPEVSPFTVRYLNRLSDALFVWARWINAEVEAPEFTWNPKTQPPE